MRVQCHSLFSRPNAKPVWSSVSGAIVAILLVMMAVFCWRRRWRAKAPRKTYRILNHPLEDVGFFDLETFELGKNGEKVFLLRDLEQ